MKDEGGGGGGKVVIGWWVELIRGSSVYELWCETLEIIYEIMEKKITFEILKKLFFEKFLTLISKVSKNNFKGLQRTLQR